MGHHDKEYVYLFMCYRDRNVSFTFCGTLLALEYNGMTLYDIILSPQSSVLNRIGKYTLEQEQIARFAKAMGHPARMAILEFLAKQDCCFFGDIHEELPIAKATVSQHLKELKEAGLIQGEIETPKVKYCINRENWKIASMLFSKFFGQCVCKKESCCE